MYRIIGKVNKGLDQTALQDDLIGICKWCNNRKIALNFKKCKIMHFGPKIFNSNYHLLDDININHVYNLKLSEILVFWCLLI